MKTYYKLKSIIKTSFTKEMVSIFITTIFSILVVWGGSLLSSFGEITKKEITVSYLHLIFIGLFSAMVGSLIIYNFLRYHIDTLKVLSNIDDLTGLNNSRELNRVLDYQIKESKRYKKDFSVILFDLDNFKYINDEVSYKQGDSVLKQVSELMQKGNDSDDSSKKYYGFRNSDILFRYKLGDEFLVFLPNTRIAGAKKAAQRLRDAISDFHFKAEVPNTIVRITISASVVGFDYEKDTLNSLLERANVLLHKAKSVDKKNRVIAEQQKEIVAKEIRVVEHSNITNTEGLNPT